MRTYHRVIPSRADGKEPLPLALPHTIPMMRSSASLRVSRTLAFFSTPRRLPAVVGWGVRSTARERRGYNSKSLQLFND